MQINSSYFNLVTSSSHQMLKPDIAIGDEEAKSGKMQNRHHSNCSSSRTPNSSVSKRKAVFTVASAVSRFRSVLASAIARRRRWPPRVVGTLYGRRQGRGHVHLSFQLEAQMQPVLLLELPTPTNEFVKEMAASGFMRIALECERGGGLRLLEEPMWRVYCNGLRRGYAVRRECRQLPL